MKGNTPKYCSDEGCEAEALTFIPETGYALCREASDAYSMGQEGLDEYVPENRKLRNVEDWRIITADGLEHEDYIAAANYERMEMQQ